MIDTEHKYPIGPINFERYGETKRARRQVLTLPNGSFIDFSIDEDVNLTVSWLLAESFSPAQLLEVAPYIFEHDITAEDVCYRDEYGYMQDALTVEEIDEHKDKIISFSFDADFKDNKVFVEFANNLVHVTSDSLVPVRAMAELCCDDAILSRIDEMVPNGN